MWQPWLAAVALALAASNLVTFVLYRTVLVEFSAVGSALGCLVGVWAARQIGLRVQWPMGLVVGVGIDAVAFVVAWSWLTWALLPLGKVG